MIPPVMGIRGLSVFDTQHGTQDYSSCVNMWRGETTCHTGSLENTNVDKCTHNKHKNRCATVYDILLHCSSMSGHLLSYPMLFYRSFSALEIVLIGNIVASAFYFISFLTSAQHYEKADEQQTQAH